MRILSLNAKLWREKEFRGYSSAGRASRSQEDFKNQDWFFPIWTRLDSLPVFEELTVVEHSFLLD
jgi:hypothetical protein